MQATQETMTLPKDSKQLDDNEVYSIENAVKEAGITQVHPDKLEAWGDELVNRIKTGAWRTGGPLEE